MGLNFGPLKGEYPEKGQNINAKVGRVVEGSPKTSLKVEEPGNAPIEHICNQTYAQQKCKPPFMAHYSQVKNNRKT